MAPSYKHLYKWLCLLPKKSRPVGDAANPQDGEHGNLLVAESVLRELIRAKNAAA